MTTKALFGFTLAEVLITLGIIGIVAAMTIPTLMTNNQSKKLKSQFLKSYSTISQAYRLMLEMMILFQILIIQGVNFIKLL